MNIPFMVYTHLIVLGEERYCEATYGDEYRTYKARTPRYFLLCDGSGGEQVPFSTRAPR